jgi:broad specificity phosphatase PhoE
MTKFLFLRHASSLSNMGEKFCGQTDVPLTEIGFEQAKDVCQYIYDNLKIDLIYSSDLLRVRQTIAPLLEKIDLEPIFDKNLREIDVGSWAGKKVEEVKETDGQNFERFRAGDVSVVLGGKESFDMVYDRAFKVINEIARKHDGKTILVATHAGVIRMLIEKWLNIPDVQMRKTHDIGNASISEVDYDGENVKVITISKNDFLKNTTKERMTGKVFQ